MFLRNKWRKSWQKILEDPVIQSSRESKGADQDLLSKWVWPWGKLMAMQHDSYT